MTLMSSADVAFLLANGMNILGDTTQIEDNLTALMEEKTPLGTAWDEHAAIGVSRYELTQQGFYNDASNRSNAALVGLGSVKLCFALEGGDIGDTFIGALINETNYRRQSSRGALTKANASYLSEGTYEEGLILHDLSAETADGNTEADSLDNGSSSAAGASVWLQVTAIDLDGYDDVLITVTDSSDDMTFGTLQAFTAVTAIGAQRIEVAGTVERYVALSFDFEGSGTSPSITFMAGIVRN